VRIRLVRQGGFAGVRRAAVVDTETLEPSRAGELHRLVEAARAEGLLPEDRTKPRADRFGYTLTVDDAGRERTLRFGEENAPEALKTLVEAIWREAGEGPGTRRA